jgi:hypothetical protein
LLHGFFFIAQPPRLEKAGNARLNRFQNFHASKLAKLQSRIAATESFAAARLDTIKSVPSVKNAGADRVTYLRCLSAPQDVVNGARLEAIASTPQPYPAGLRTNQYR